MKKLVLTSVCMLAVAGAAFAQGSVNWSVISPAALTLQTNSTASSAFGVGGTAAQVGGSVGGTSFAANSFYAELLYGAYTGSQAAAPTTLAALSTWSDTGLKAVNGTSTAGKLVPVNGSTQVTVPWAAGVTQSIVLAVWSSNMGTTWAEVLNLLNNWSTLGSTVVGQAYFGFSNTGYIAPNAANPGVSLFAASGTSAGLPINSLNTQLYLLNVPEPGTMALAALGGASLLLFRRRK